MSKLLRGTVNLPGSKSESNRALMIAAYGGFPLDVDGLSDAHDTVLLKQLLELTSSTLDCQDAGAVARFLLTYLAGKPGIWLLTGTQRLCERPMAPLIDSLRRLGSSLRGMVSCEAMRQPTCDGLPVIIEGHPLKGGSVTLDASQSSQFATSLLMAAPTWEHGIQLTLTGSPVSQPYLEMTLAMMAHFGVKVERDGNVIAVAPQPYRPCHFTVSADWSAASYWYELMALSDGGELLLKGLSPNSLQGDAAVVDMFAKLGVKTDFVDDGVRISKASYSPLSVSEPITFDFINTPDLFPSVFVSCVALNVDAIFKGIATLSKKESDRINSLITELSKFYTFINILCNDEIIIEKSSLKTKQFDTNQVIINTYRDHRIAMALAALQLRLGRLEFDNPLVVNKSYPRYWCELKKFL